MLRRPARDKQHAASQTAAAAAAAAAKTVAASASPLPQPLHVLYAVGLLLAALAYRPTLEERHSAAAAPEAAFDSARASAVMDELCRLGPRTAGSAAAERARRLLRREVESIARIAAGSGASLEVATVRASGAFYTDFLDGFTNVYHNATSLVARLSWPGSRPEAVLLNAHYDSFPGSPGGSDNAVNVGAALGALRALAAGPALPVSLLLLLNGGEESNWVAAHAFATGGHAWAAEYRVVFNLEAIGAGGPSVIFQLGPDAPWLADALSRAAHTPRGSVLGHELFQIPQFPAATDLKTLLVHAPHHAPPHAARHTPPHTAPHAPHEQHASPSWPERPVGIDAAILGNGYVYHTPNDRPVHAPARQVARLGANTLSVLRASIDGLDARLAETRSAARRESAVTPPREAAVAHGAESAVPPPRALLFKGRREAHDNPQRLDEEAGDVFFDYLGLAWVSYRRPTARLVHAAAAAAAIGAMLVTRVRLAHLLAELRAQAWALLAVLLLSAALYLARPMACYGSLPLTVALYAPLALGVSIRRRHAALAGGVVTTGQPPSARTLSAASLATPLLALAAAERARLGSAYILALLCGINGLALVLCSALCHLARAPTAALWVQVLGALLPILHLHSVSSWLFEVLVPITGRIPLPIELAVALLVGLIAALPSSTVVSPLHAAALAPLPQNTRRRLCPAAAVSRGLLLLSGVSLVGALGRARFSPAAPKRLLVQHISREVDGVPLDAGLWVSAGDPTGLATARHEWRSLGLPAIASRTAHPCDLDLPSGATGCYLSFPYYFPFGSVLGRPDGAHSVYATEILPFPEGAPLPIRPPTVHGPRRLSLTATLTNSSGIGRAAIHRVRIHMRGPSHMGLALPEERLVGWSIAPGTPPPRRSPLAPNERLTFAFCTSEAPVLDGADGGAGLDGEPRVWELWVDVAGEEPLELAAYGHYLDMSSTPELATLAKWTPEAVSLGYWNFFSSMLARRTVPMHTTSHAAAS